MNANKYQVPALLKASDILDMLSREQAGLTKIIEKLKLSKSSTYSLLLTLEEIGFIRRLPDGQKFALGFRLFELGNLAIAKVSIRDQALSFLNELSHKEKVSCHLGMLEGSEAVYLVKVDPDDSILINSWEGKRLALSSSAMGKVLLAALPADKQQELLDVITFTRKTPKTIIDKDVFKQHLVKVTQQGWAIDDEEDVPGLRCIAAPVFFPDKTNRLYSLSITSTVQSITQDRIPSLVEIVKKTAQNISKSLGAPMQQ